MMFLGSYVALVTPMQTDGSLDLEALAKLIQWQISQDTDGIIVLGTTGESVTLNTNERQQVIETAIKVADAKVPVIVGVGTNSTETSIANAKQAQELGADALLVVTPYYNKPTQHGLYEHYQAIHDATNSLIVLYNVPGRTGCDLQPKTVAQLTEVCERIVALKEAVAEPERWRELRKYCPKNFALLSGDDATAAEFVLKGGNGVISVTANVAPKTMSAMIHAAIAKDERKTQALNEQLQALHTNLFLESNPIPAKWALQRMGRIEGKLRLPLTSLSGCYHKELEAAMQQAGVL